MPRESSCATHGDRFAERIVEVPVDEASFADTRLACAHTGCDCRVAMRGLWTAWGCKHTEEHQLQINLLHGEKKVFGPRQELPACVFNSCTGSNFGKSLAASSAASLRGTE